MAMRPLAKRGAQPSMSHLLLIDDDPALIPEQLATDDHSRDERQESSRFFHFRQWQLGRDLGSGAWPGRNRQSATQQCHAFLHSEEPPGPQIGLGMFRIEPAATVGD